MFLKTFNPIVKLIPRTIEVETIVDEFKSSSPPNYVYFLSGPYGSGKSTLLSSITNHFLIDDWIVIRLEWYEISLSMLAFLLYENGKTKGLFKEGDFVSIFLEKKPIFAPFTLLRKMLDEVKRNKKRVLITIDEVDTSEQMMFFIQAYQSLIRLKYPVFLLMTGFYDNISKLQDYPFITFLYRAPKIYLEPLSISDIAFSYSKFLGVSYEKGVELAKLTKGYAYAYQVLAYLLTKQNKKDIDEEVLSNFDHYLSDHVYAKVYSELSKKEQEIVACFPSNESIKVEVILKQANLDNKTFSVHRDRLLKKGIIQSPAYGYLEFTLPRFYEYLLTK